MIATLENSSCEGRLGESAPAWSCLEEEQKKRFNSLAEEKNRLPKIEVSEQNRDLLVGRIVAQMKKLVSLHNKIYRFSVLQYQYM